MMQAKHVPHSGLCGSIVSGRGLLPMDAGGSSGPHSGRFPPPVRWSERSGTECCLRRVTDQGVRRRGSVGHRGHRSQQPRVVPAPCRGRASARGDRVSRHRVQRQQVPSDGDLGLHRRRLPAWPAVPVLAVSAQRPAAAECARPAKTPPPWDRRSSSPSAPPRNTGPWCWHRTPRRRTSAYSRATSATRATRSRKVATSPGSTSGATRMRMFCATPDPSSATRCRRGSSRGTFAISIPSASGRCTSSSVRRRRSRVCARRSACPNSGSVSLHVCAASTPGCRVCSSSTTPSQPGRA